MNDRKLMRQALDALVYAYREDEAHPNTKEIATALRERLAQPNPRPLAWYDPAADEAYAASEVEEAEEARLIPLYATLPLRKLASLADEQIQKARAVETALKVSNG